MNAPDKIYIQQDMINNIPLEQKEFDDDVEYIRKDTILEWLNTKVNDYGYTTPFRIAIQCTIDKINSL